jgi:hypothetical protein
VQFWLAEADIEPSVVTLVDSTSAPTFKLYSRNQVNDGSNFVTSRVVGAARKSRMEIWEIGQ